MEQAILENISSKKMEIMKQINIKTYKGPLLFEQEILLRPNDQHDTTQKGSADRVFAESNRLKNGNIK